MTYFEKLPLHATLGRIWTASATPRRMQRAVGAPVSIRWHVTTLSYSRASWTGEHCLRGFHNRDIRARLASTVHLLACGQDPKKEGANVSRTFRRFHPHGLIAKVPWTRRWRVTLYGRRVMGTSLYLRDYHFREAYSRIPA